VNIRDSACARTLDHKPQTDLRPPWGFQIALRHGACSWPFAFLISTDDDRLHHLSLQPISIVNSEIVGTLPLRINMPLRCDEPVVQETTVRLALISTPITSPALADHKMTPALKTGPPTSSFTTTLQRGVVFTYRHARAAPSRS
jgi:hypothetical protein